MYSFRIPSMAIVHNYDGWYTQLCDSCALFRTQTLDGYSNIHTYNFQRANALLIQKLSGYTRHC